MMDAFDLGPTRGVRPEELASAAPSLSDIMMRSVDDARRVSNWNAHRYNLTDVYDEIADRVKGATGDAIENPIRAWSGDPQRAWAEAIGKLKAVKPDALDWDALAAEPEQRAWSMMREAREQTNTMNEVLGLADPKAGMLGGVPIMGSLSALARNVATQPGTVIAQMAGSLYGQLSSPVDTAANLVGFAAGGAAGSILKNALLNAASNAAVQGVLSAGKQDDYAKAGLPSGWKIWLEEVEGAAATGFALDAGIRTPARAVVQRFGRDVEAGKAFSKNTPRGGFLRDAEPPAATPKVDAQTLRKAADGDLAAARQVAEATGALEDPAVRGAFDHVENGGRLTEASLRELESLGVERVYGMRMLADALDGRESLLPAPAATAAGPLAPDIGAGLLGRIGAQLESFPEQVRQAVRDGLEAGVPAIVATVQAELAKGADGLGARLAGTISPAMAASARMASGLASPVEAAALIRRYPGVLQSNVTLDTDRIRMARDIATLEEAAFEAVARRRVPPEIGALVAQRVAPAHQARIIEDIVKLAPKTLAEARDILDQVAPEPRAGEGRVPLLPRGSDSGIADPTPERVEALRGEAGQALETAMAPIARRAELQSRIEDLKGKIAVERADQEQFFDPSTGERLTRSEVDDIVQAFEFVRDMKRQRPPKSLVDFLREMGGVRDETGDIRHTLGEARQRPGLISRRGMEPDEATLRAWERGYLGSGERPDINALYDAIGEDISGNRIYSDADLSIAEDLRLAREMESDLAKYGIKARDANGVRRHFATRSGDQRAPSDSAATQGARSSRDELAAAERELAEIENAIEATIRDAGPVSLEADIAMSERLRQAAELTAACRE